MRRNPPPPPLGNPAFSLTQHVPDRLRTTRLGQVIRVPGTVAGSGVGPGPFPPNQSNLQLIHSLVMADNLDIEDDTPWVLAIACNITKNFIDSEDEQWVIPLLAEITMGAGGASHTFRIDAWPYCTIQLPAGAVKVIIRWDIDKITGLIQSFPDVNTGAIQFITPQEVEVAGTLVRGFSSSNAKRSFLIQTNADAPLNTGKIEIPDFAVKGFYWADDYTVLAGTLSYFEHNQAGFALANYTIAELIALKAIGELTPLPANAGFWQLALTAPDPTPLAPTRVSFPIRL